MAEKKTTTESKTAQQKRLLEKLERLENLHAALDNLAKSEDKFFNLDQIKQEFEKLKTELSGFASERSVPVGHAEEPVENTKTSVLFPESFDKEQIPPAENSADEEQLEVNLEAIIADIDRGIIQQSNIELDQAQESSLRESIKNRERHILFTLADTQYAVPAANVQEVGEVLKITPIPNVPDWLVGVVNLRGDIISMVDLRVFLGLEPMIYQQRSRMLVTQAGPENMVIGLIVDQVSAIRFLQLDKIAAPTAPIENRVTSYLQGVYEHEDHLLIVLDIEQLLLSSEMQQFQPA